LRSTVIEVKLFISSARAEEVRCGYAPRCGPET
jgi:hypothetical protein